MFSDLDARCLAAVPRTMIESKGGESIKGMSIKDAELIDFGARLVRDARHHRPREHPVLPRADGRLQVTDVNPRFGGGFPLPTAAGSRYPEIALALARGERPEPRLGDFREGVVMTRFFSQVILEDRAEDVRRARAGGGGARGSVRRLGLLLAGALLAGCGARAGGADDDAPRRTPPPRSGGPTVRAARRRGLQPLFR